MAVATKLLFDTLHDRKDNAMLFGDACFEVTGPMAQISKWWNMSQVGNFKLCILIFACI